MVDQNIITSDFIIKWHDNELDLDPKSILFDEESQQKFRSLLSHFIDWLKDETESESSQSESSSSSDEDSNLSDDEDEITSADLELEIPLDQEIKEPII